MIGPEVMAKTEEIAQLAVWSCTMPSPAPRGPVAAMLCARTAALGYVVTYGMEREDAQYFLRRTEVETLELLRGVFSPHDLQVLM